MMRRFVRPVTASAASAACSRALTSTKTSACRRRALVFVEVTARAAADDAAVAVTERGKRRIIAAAELWLAAHPDDVQRDIRFDVMLVAPGRMPRHIANAFDASR